MISFNCRRELTRRGTVPACSGCSASHRQNL